MCLQNDTQLGRDRKLPLLLLVLVVATAVPIMGGRNIQTKMFAKPWHIEIVRSLFSHKVSLKEKVNEKKEIVCVKCLFTAVLSSVANCRFYADVSLMTFLLNFHLMLISA